MSFVTNLCSPEVSSACDLRIPRKVEADVHEATTYVQRRINFLAGVHVVGVIRF